MSINLISDLWDVYIKTVFNCHTHTHTHSSTNKIPTGTLIFAYMHSDLLHVSTNQLAIFGKLKYTGERDILKITKLNYSNIRINPQI